MKKQENNEFIQGRLYSFKIEEKQVKNKDSKNFGKTFLQAELDVAMDEDGYNIVKVRYPYVVEETTNGGINRTYKELQSIMSKGKTWVQNGKDEATLIELSTNLAINDYYDRTDTLVSLMTNQGGFIRVVNQLRPATTKPHDFVFDIIMTGIKRVEPQDETEQEFLRINGYIFDFRNQILPVTLTVREPAGMEYFESQDISTKNVFYTKVWGNIDWGTAYISKEEQSAFGESIVKQVPIRKREWVITGASPEPYEFDSEATITNKELTEALQTRELHLAEVKKSRDEYNNNNKDTASAFETTPASAPTQGINPGSFVF